MRFPAPTQGNKELCPTTWNCRGSVWASRKRDTEPPAFRRRSSRTLSRATRPIECFRLPGLESQGSVWARNNVIRILLSNPFSENRVRGWGVLDLCDAPSSVLSHFVLL